MAGTLLATSACSSLAPPAQVPDKSADEATTPRAPHDIAVLPQTPDSASRSPAPGLPAQLATGEDGGATLHIEDDGLVQSEGNLWDRIRKGFALPSLQSPLVAYHERELLAHPEALQRMIERSRPYLFHIIDEVEKRGLPSEIALLPFVESAMNPHAVSHAKAAGLWQFIPSTGRAYDLEQNWWVDRRRDVVESTRAALDHLEYVHAFNGGDWFLALASYNWGEGAVARARRANRRSGRPDDYAHLRMPRETRHYVPKLIALRNLIARADSLSLPLAPLPDQPYFAVIDKLRPMDLALAARFAGLSTDEFVRLNPAHHRPVISASRDSRIVLPADRLARFRTAVRKHEAAGGVFASWQPYTLADGDTLADVATRFAVPIKTLREANGLRASTKLLAGSEILAPQPDVRDESRIEHFAGARLVEQVHTPARYYTVRKRESLALIAQRWGMTVVRLRSLNGISSKVRFATPGTRLRVRPAATQTVVTSASGKRQIVRNATVASRSTAQAPAGQPATQAKTLVAHEAEASPAGSSAGAGMGPARQISSPRFSAKQPARPM